MDSLLLEIGTEEIPAGYIKPALNALSDNLLKKLDSARIDHGGAVVYGTPRRLVVMVSEVAEKQKTITEKVMGPPEKIAVDKDGGFTIPAIKFAEKVGINVNAVDIVETEKGRYLSAEITEKGLASKTILKDILPEVILATPFPKSMKWADLSIVFARPIQTLVALLGPDVIPFTLGGKIESSRNALGHMFMNPGKVSISDPESYLDAMKAVNVVADIETRKAMTKAEVDKAAQTIGGTVLPDEELLDIVTNLVETPIATAGRFDDVFLEVPREVLITAMREHQKYFAVADDNGDLMPGFVAVNNTRTKDMDLVSTGHERVLRARLSDARFFFQADVKVPMDAWVEKLKGVLFQAKLGSMHEKALRVKEVAGFIADQVEPALKANVQRAALLCKADLVSQVVVEFPKLQGVMGRNYALIAGEEKEVALAIEEHYRPTSSGGKLPGTRTGALLSIAEKMDSICGCFSVGLVPTGASDPYALRRQGIGIIRILRNLKLKLSLSALIEKSVSLFAEKTDQDPSETAKIIYTFLQNRLSRILAEEGYSKDIIAAVVSVSSDNMTDVETRVGALEKMKGQADFEPLAAAFKRVVNILKKAGDITSTSVEPSLFEDNAEGALFDACLSVKKKVDANLEKGDLTQALLDIASLRTAVDTFFDEVMVMAEDEKIKMNRLALLATISGLFDKIADFSKISV